VGEIPDSRLLSWSRQSSAECGWFRISHSTANVFLRYVGMSKVHILRGEFQMFFAKWVSRLALALSFAVLAGPVAAQNNVGLTAIGYKGCAQMVQAALKDPEISRRMLDMGSTGRAPRAFADAMKQDDQLWGPVIKASNYRVTE
jgi:hypothetical protein